MGRDKQNDLTIKLLERINHDIENFIKSSIEASSDISRWSDLHREFEHIKCWEIKGCAKKDCPAYQNEDYRCWLIAGTFCGGVVQGEFAKKYGTCFKCNIFQNIFGQQPVRRLYENIDILISHLHNRAVQLREMAIKDHLTDTYNRHFFNEIIERELVSARRKNNPLSFVMIDIDNLKDINDSHGHLTGDRILVEAVALIKNAVRKSDIVIRYGGDEFLIFMNDGGCDETAVMIDRISELVDVWNRDKAAVFGCRLSLSMGCATCDKDCDVYDALKIADERMYQDKREKKN